MTDLTVPQTLLHPLKAKVVGFHEEAEEYSFQVEYPDPPVCTACGVRRARRVKRAPERSGNAKAR